MSLASSSRKSSASNSHTRDHGGSCSSSPSSLPSRNSSPAPKWWNHRHGWQRTQRRVMQRRSRQKFGHLVCQARSTSCLETRTNHDVQRGKTWRKRCCENRHHRPLLMYLQLLLRNASPQQSYGDRSSSSVCQCSCSRYQVNGASPAYIATNDHFAKASML